MVLIGAVDVLSGREISFSIFYLIPITFVTLRVGYTASPEMLQTLQQHVRHDLGPIAQPGEIDFVDRLPKTRSGKIMRRLLKANELGLEPGDITTLED